MCMMYRYCMLLFFVFVVPAAYTVQAQPCTHRPVLMIHGMLGAGDNYAAMALQLEKNGYCRTSLHVYDWNTLSRNNAEVNRLDSFIQRICATTGTTQVDLVGHSAGGSLAYAYLNDSMRSQRVAHYIHIGSRPMPKPAGVKGEVATLNVYSTADRTVKGADIPGATNVQYSTYDHFGLVTADSVAMAVFAFIQEGATTPAHKKKSSKERQSILLRVLQMGENKPDAEAYIECQQLNQNGEAVGVAQKVYTSANGEVLLNNIAQGSPYWITCKPRSGRSVAYYYPAITAGPVPLYLRTLPATGMVNLLLGGIPTSPQAAAWVLFNANAAISPDKNVLMINGDTLNTTAITPSAKTVVALFLYDNGDMQTSKQQQGIFGQAPFMNGIDYYLPTTSSVQTLQWQQKKLQIPLVPAAQFVTVVVLE